MSRKPVAVAKLPTGVPGLDEVLGGGLPEFSFNLLAGSPGCGKTTFAHQVMFANATKERPALYFTILGEPPLKMLRYQQQFSFFDDEKVESAIRFIHLGRDLLQGGLKQVLERIVREVDEADPRLVFVDSFRSVSRVFKSANEPESGLQGFVQELALHLTSCEATTFLVGEYLDEEASSNPIFTVADGILWLYQTALRNSVVRRLQVHKIRGQKEIPGFHTLKISEDGIRVFPRLPLPSEQLEVDDAKQLPIKGTGVAALDEMLGGGVPAGYSISLAGPSGSGKSVLSTQFILEGVEQGEPGVIVVFEKRPQDYLKTSSQGKSLNALTKAGKIKLIYIRPLDLSVDETLEQVRAEVIRLGARRVVVDSLSGFELALAPAFREDFRESLYRMVGALTPLGVTVMLTVEVTDSFTELRLSPHGLSFLTDGIILQRYAELEGRLQKVMTVVKLRGRKHSTQLRAYEIDENGIVIGEAMSAFQGLLTGNAQTTKPPPLKPAATKGGHLRRR
ncbi:MAG: RAD55 family ATPase [Myxococcaceae bacterium]